MKRAMLLPGALAVVLLAAACSSGPGPLGSSIPVNGVDCADNGIGQVIIVGFLQFQDYGKLTVTVSAVRLTDNHGLAMGTPWLAPVLYNTNIGMGYSWPPTLKLFPAWKYREHADGAVVRPGQAPDLVVPVWRTLGVIVRHPDAEAGDPGQQERVAPHRADASPRWNARATSCQRHRARRQLGLDDGPRGSRNWRWGQRRG
jgi:hypothetical protein